MLRRPVFVGVEDIMSGFDNLSKTGDQVFAVWYNDREVAFQCCIDDPATQRDMLENNLEGLKRSGNTDLLYLKMYPAGLYGYIDGSSKQKAISNTPIQVCEYQTALKPSGEPSELPAVRPQGISKEAWDLLHRMETLPDTIEERINKAVDAKIADMILEEDHDEEDPMTKTMGMINGLTQNPVIMQLIGKVFEFLSSLKPQVQTMYPQPTIGMAETTAPLQQERIPFNEEAMNNALDVLSYHCDLGACLTKLANIAQNNPVYFKTLISMLMNS